MASQPQRREVVVFNRGLCRTFSDFPILPFVWVLVVRCLLLCLHSSAENLLADLRTKLLHYAGRSPSTLKAGKQIPTHCYFLNASVRNQRTQLIISCGHTIRQVCKSLSFMVRQALRLDWELCSIVLRATSTCWWFCR